MTSFVDGSERPGQTVSVDVFQTSGIIRVDDIAQGNGFLVDGEEAGL